jgi:hypothetical protein
VLDIGDFAAVEGQQRRVALVQASALEPLGEKELAQGAVGGGVVVAVPPSQQLSQERFRNVL